MPKGSTRRLAGALLLALAATPCAVAADAGPLLAHIKAVGPEGDGNAEAGRAWRELVALGPDALPAILSALRRRRRPCGQLAARRRGRRGRARSRRRPQAARRQAGSLRQGDEKRTRRPPTGLRMADAHRPHHARAGCCPECSTTPASSCAATPSRSSSRTAREKLEKKDRDSAKSAFKKALGGARDQDQVDAIAKALKDLGEPVDIAAHFGFVRTWQLIGPFDSTGGKGYAAAFGPEKKVDLTAALAGKGDKEVRWAAYTTDDPYGNVDLNKAIGKHMGAAGYAYAVLESPAERAVEVRAATKNAVKIFVNGERVFAKEEYHHGKYLDQHVARVTLHKGRNTLLLKVCQNEQTDTWAQEWDFQVRVCDAVGGAVPFTVIQEKGK